MEAINDDVIANEATANSVSAPVRKLSRRMRFTLFVHGVVVPIWLLYLSFHVHSVTGDTPWQSGEFTTYLEMLLRPSAWCCFAPFMALSAVSMACWTIRPSIAQRAWVRVGIYSGVLVAAHFCIIVSIIAPFIWLAALVVWPAWHGVLWLLNYYWRRQLSILHILLLMTIGAVLCIVIARYGTDVVNFPFGALFTILVAGPVLNALAYIWAAVCIARERRRASLRSSRAVIISLIAMLIAWFVAWRFALIAMLDEYHRLPTERPNCYMSSAASFAHPRLTGARERGVVTIGMRRFKFLELVFKSLVPGWHRRIRKQYDAWCPPVAAGCQRYTLLASLTYLGLMPVELLAELMRWMLGLDRKYVDRIYVEKQTSTK